MLVVLHLLHAAINRIQTQPPTITLDLEDTPPSDRRSSQNRRKMSAAALLPDDSSRRSSSDASNHGGGVGAAYHHRDSLRSEGSGGVGGGGGGIGTPIKFEMGGGHSPRRGTSFSTADAAREHYYHKRRHRSDVSPVDFAADRRTLRHNWITSAPKGSLEIRSPAKELILAQQKLIKTSGKEKNASDSRLEHHSISHLHRTAEGKEDGAADEGGKRDGEEGLEPGRRSRRSGSRVINRSPFA